MKRTTKKTVLLTVKVNSGRDSDARVPNYAAEYWLRGECTMRTRSEYANNKKESGIAESTY